MDLEYYKGVLFVRLDGKLNKKSTYKLNNYLIPTIKKHKIKYLVCNLYNLCDIDSSGINALLTTKYVIKNNKGKLCFCEVSDNIINYVNNLRVKITDNELTALDLIGV